MESIGEFILNNEGVLFIVLFYTVPLTVISIIRYYKNKQAAVRFSQFLHKNLAQLDFVSEPIKARVGLVMPGMDMVYSGAGAVDARFCVEGTVVRLFPLKMRSWFSILRTKKTPYTVRENKGLSNGLPSNVYLADSELVTRVEVSSYYPELLVEFDTFKHPLQPIERRLVWFLQFENMEQRDAAIQYFKAE